MSDDRLNAMEERLNRHETAFEEIREGLAQVNKTLETQMTNLISALTGVNKIDVTTVNKLVGIFGIVIVGLVLILVFLITGEKLELFNLLGK